MASPANLFIFMRALDPSTTWTYSAHVGTNDLPEPPPTLVQLPPAPADSTIVYLMLSAPLTDPKYDNLTITCERGIGLHMDTKVPTTVVAFRYTDYDRAWHCASDNALMGFTFRRAMEAFAQGYEPIFGELDPMRFAKGL